MVRAPVGHLAAGIIPEKAEVVMDTMFVIGPGRSRAKPHIVVKLSGRLAVGHERIRGPVHSHQTDQDALDSSDATVADVFRRLEELGFGTLLAAALDDAIGFARR